MWVSWDSLGGEAVRNKKYIFWNIRGRELSNPDKDVLLKSPGTELKAARAEEGKWRRSQDTACVFPLP